MIGRAAHERGADPWYLVRSTRKPSRRRRSGGERAGSRDSHHPVARAPRARGRRLHHRGRRASVRSHRRPFIGRAGSAGCADAFCKSHQRRGTGRAPSVRAPRLAVGGGVEPPRRRAAMRPSVGVVHSRSPLERFRRGVRHERSCSPPAALASRPARAPRAEVAVERAARPTSGIADRDGRWKPMESSVLSEAGRVVGLVTTRFSMCPMRFDLDPHDVARTRKRAGSREYPTRPAWPRGDHVARLEREGSRRGSASAKESKMSCPVLESWRSSPFTQVRRRSACGSRQLVAVTIHGPIGPWCRTHLHHRQVGTRSCQSRHAERRSSTHPARRCGLAARAAARGRQAVRSRSPARHRSRGAARRAAVIGSTGPWSRRLLVEEGGECGPASPPTSATVDRRS